MKIERVRDARVGDYVKLRDEKGWWRVDGKRRGWLRLAQERKTEEDQISALESTVTMVAPYPKGRKNGKLK